MNSAYKLQLQKSASDKKKVKSKLDGLSSLSSNKVDNQLHKLHGEVFQKIDCLQCANCCKNYESNI